MFNSAYADIATHLNPTHAFLGADYFSPEIKISFYASLLPGLSFYSQALKVVINAGKIANNGLYSPELWALDSMRIIAAAQNVGGKFCISGLDEYRKLTGPCIFVANHMSTLETFTLPAIIQPWKAVTFVVKQSLLQYPYFGAVLGARDPIVVGRKNARDDLSAVLDGGLRRLSEGISLIIFPQSTRSVEFDAKKFNTIAIKLAKKANVPVVPIALKTDFWSNGKLLKDFGYIHPERIVYFKFGAPFAVAGNGKDEHAHVCEFIQSSLAQWKDNQNS